MSKATGPYRVEVEKNGCNHCGSGKRWVVIESRGLGGIPHDFPYNFDEIGPAEQLTQYLNDAYTRGKEDSGMLELLEALKTIEEAILNRNVELPDPKALIRTARLAIDKAEGGKVLA